MAGGRPSDWSPLDLEADPVPGDPERVKQLARKFHQFSEDVGEALRSVHSMSREDSLATWVGKSADSFREGFEGVPGNLTKLRDSYGLAGDALTWYWPELEKAQSQSLRALHKAQEAQRDLSHANSRLDTANAWVDRAGREADKHQTDGVGGGGGKGKAPGPDEGQVRAAVRNAKDARSSQSSAQSAVNDAQSQLDAAKKMAADARKLREEAAEDCKRKLDEASDAGIQNRNMFEEATKWVGDHWDDIVAVCKVVVAVLGIVVMIIGGPILAAIVVVAALVVLADTLNKYRKGQAGLMDVGLAALDCIPGAKGLTSAAKLAAGAKGLAAGAKALRGAGGVRRMLSGASKRMFSRGDGAVARGCSDPVDMATGIMFLPQTDVSLPGTLPLTFVRRHASNYRAGRWFGPTWTSTLDQHLEVDEEGIVFATEDGLLLEYPLPATGGVSAAGDEPSTGPGELTASGMDEDGSQPTPEAAPVYPAEGGPRWPLLPVSGGGFAVTDPGSGHTRRFAAPDPAGYCRIEELADRHDNRLIFTYDEAGRPAGLVHSGGYQLRVQAAEGRITALDLVGAAPDGSDQRLMDYGYTGGHLTSVANSTGIPTRFTYDDAGRMTAWTDTNDRSYAYRYDEHDRCTSQGGEAGHITLTFGYDQTAPNGNRLTTVTEPNGHTTRYEINELLQVVAETDPLGNTTHTAWDEHDRVLARTDALGHTTTNTYDTDGRLIRATRPDGMSTRFTYDSAGQPVQVTAPDGATWRQDFDASGNRTSATDPTGATTEYTYNDLGHLTAVTDALGHTTTVVSDAAGLPLEVTDPLAAVTRYRRDTFGNPIKITDALGEATHLTWTVEGKPTTRTAPDGARETWTWDGEGNCTHHTDAGGGVTSYEYGHFDVLTARTDPDGTRYSFTHDARLRLTQVTNPQSLAWSYTHDPAGRLVSETDFDNRTVRYEHDPAGRLTARTTPLGETIRFEYDVLGQILRKDAAGKVTDYAYDPSGRLLSAGGPDAEVRYERDELGRITTELVNGRALSHTYDTLGRPARRETPTGAVTTCDYDAAGNRTQLTAHGHTVNFEHDLLGREIGRSVGDALQFAQLWDPAGRLASQTVTGPNVARLQRRTYTYRPDGHLTGIDDALNGPSRFTLDEAGRVTTVRARRWTETYAYDAVGNQTDAAWPDKHPGAESRGGRTYTGTRIRTAGSVRYEHDAAGRMVLRQKARLSKKPDTWRYEWDAEDRLIRCTTPDGTVWRYRYDPFGRRTSKQRLDADGVAVVEQVDFTWDGSTLVEQSTSGPQLLDPIVLTWDHHGLQPIVQMERRMDEASQREIDSRFFAIITDLIGTPTELLDEQGDIAWRTRTTLWGAITWSTNATAYTPLRFPGQYHDPETALHYNHHRHYDPETARYATPDPLGLAAAPNPVAYVHNPHTWTDPVGLAPCEIFYRAMSKKEFANLGPNGEISIKGTENFVTQERGYVQRIADQFARRGGRQAEKYTHLVTYRMEPGTRDALIAAGRGSGDNMAAISDNFGIDLAEIGSDVNHIHVKMEREGLNFGLRPGSADVFNSRIMEMRHELL